MSVSRRQFITAGAAAAAVAGSASSFGLATPANAAASKQGTISDPFASSANFAPYVGTPFSLQLGSSAAESATLRAVNDFRLPASKRGAKTSSGTPTGAGYSLTFDGSNLGGTPSGTYTVKHAALGTFQIFLTRVGAGRDYQAVINRLN